MTYASSIDAKIATNTHTALNCVFSSARILQTAAAQGMVPKPHIFQQENKRLGTPINALILNWCITVLLICAPPAGKAFTFLLPLAAYPAWIFYGLSLLGLILFRRFQPNWPRPYRVWLIAPIVVICMSSFLAIFPFLGEDWLNSLVRLSVLFLAVPLYYLIRNRFTIEKLEFEDDARAADIRKSGTMGRDGANLRMFWRKEIRNRLKRL
ncbi:hypothetical protein HK102_012863 [Quaeritorhiza haematococci]|nr:hypothetical protein HK102_012863 [Quaeritorhiza haematococci]